MEYVFSLTLRGVIVTGICYWLQVCTIEKKGPVFTAMFAPLSLIITATISTLLWKEPLYWGRFTFYSFNFHFQNNDAITYIRENIHPTQIATKLIMFGKRYLIFYI
ncbi:hypothetical protein Lalb_Chr01g0009591 [Lupinus albus]|uniref:WAT1-related protein n=1 Tax=Lupinus albus TaxID=3870 RepID=A0A6A4R6T6_LUPAL|nr:hypothetical protein Lalb_Chr01g0009591 [Lupinus albus]